MYQTLRGQTGKEFEVKSLLGKDYLVVPVVAMVEGVRFGMNQEDAELGLAAEFGKFVDGWNTSPVVMGHPMINGAFTSAGSPTVLETYHLGQIFHATVAEGKLKLEAWLDTSVKERDDATKSVFERVQKGEIVEVSVGFFTEVEASKGQFKGQKYAGVWRNVVPDHLAFLEEGQIGACSIEDGCGTPRINKSLKAQCSCEDLPQAVLGIHALKLGTSLTKEHMQALQACKAFIAQAIPNDLLSGDVSRSLASALAEEIDYPYIMGFTNEYVVYEAWNSESNTYTLYKRSFDINSDGKVMLGENVEEVKLITRIVAAEAANSLIPDPKEIQMTTQDVTSAPVAVEDPLVDPTAALVPAPAAPATPATLQEYIAAAPAEMREVLQSSIAMHNQRKQTLITNLKATGRCNLSDDFLKSQSLENLEQLAHLASVPMYDGVTTPVRPQTTADDAVPPAPKAFIRQVA